MKLLIHPKLQRLRHWNLGMDIQLHTRLYNGCDYFSMTGLKLVCISKGAPDDIKVTLWVGRVDRTLPYMIFMRKSKCMCLVSIRVYKRCGCHAHSYWIDKIPCPMHVLELSHKIMYFFGSGIWKRDIDFIIIWMYSGYEILSFNLCRMFAKQFLF